MVKQQHRDVQKNKNNTFYYQNQILEVVPASQKSNKIQMDSNCKTKTLNFTGHVVFHCHNCSKREGMAMHTWTINVIIFLKKRFIESKFIVAKKSVTLGHSKKLKQILWIQFCNFKLADCFELNIYNISFIFYSSKSNNQLK